MTAFKQGMVLFPQAKEIPRSSADSSVSNRTWRRTSCPIHIYSWNLYAGDTVSLYGMVVFVSVVWAMAEYEMCVITRRSKLHNVDSGRPEINNIYPLRWSSG